MDIEFDAFILWDFTKACQLKCKYCFLSYEQETAWLSLFKKMLTFMYWRDKRCERPRRLESRKLLKILDEDQKRYLIQLNGGEPFLSPGFVEECKKLTEKHLIRVVTNFVSPAVQVFLNEINPQNVYGLLISLHIEELRRLKLEDLFIRNLLLCRERGFKFTVTVVVHPAIYNEILKWKERLHEINIDIKYQVFRGIYNGKNYPDAYSHEEEILFDFFDNKKDYHRKGMLCNAGYNMAVINLDGKVSSCFMNDDIGSLDTGIKFRKEMIVCPLDECPCILPVYEHKLLTKAINECYEQ